MIITVVEVTLTFCYAVDTILFVGSFTAKGLSIEEETIKFLFKKRVLLLKQLTVLRKSLSPASNIKNKKIFIITEK